MSHRERLINWAALALALLWVALIGLTLTPEVDDFQYYWQGARSVLQYGNPYFLIHGNQPTVAYVYPPLFAYLIAAFGLLSARSGQLIWFALNLPLLAALIVVSIRLSGAQLARRYWGVATLLFVVAPPTRLTLQLGQVSILIGLVMIGSFALARRRPWLAGLLLACATLVKIYPLLLGGYFLLRQRAALWRSAAAGLAIVAASLLLHGPAPYADYLSKVVRGRDYPFFGEHNISLYGFWGRLLTTSDYGVALANAPGLARALVALSAALALGLCIWASRGPAGELAEQLRFGAWLALMMLLSPTNGSYTFVVMLLPLLAALRQIELTNDRRARAWLVLGAALLCWPPAWTDWQPQLYNALHTGWGLLLLTPALYGLLICFVLLARLARYQRQSSTSSSGP